jgi:integrase
MAKKHGFYRRGRIWWVRTDPVTKQAKSTKCTDLEAANRWRIGRERAAADPASAAAEAAELGPWADRYAALKAKTRSAATGSVVEQKLAQVLRVLGRDCRLSALVTTRVDDYVTQRRGEGVSDRTIAKEWQCLAGALRLAKRGGCFPGDIESLRPVDLVTTYVPRKRALTREELVALLAELKPAQAALVAVCVALGCRLSEALRLLPSDIDMERGRVFIRGRKTEAAERWVPVLSMYRALLEQALPYLPIDSTTPALHAAIYAACERAKIERCSPNDFRRTHATLLAEAGVDRDVTRRLLGHTTTRLVDTVYGQPRPEALGALAEERLTRAAPALPSHQRYSTRGIIDVPAENMLPPQEDYRLSKPPAGSVISAAHEYSTGSTRSAPAVRRWRRLAETSKTLHHWAGRKGGALTPRKRFGRGFTDGAPQASPEAWALTFAAERMGVRP